MLSAVPFDSAMDELDHELDKIVLLCTFKQTEAVNVHQCCSSSKSNAKKLQTSFVVIANNVQKQPHLISKAASKEQQRAFKERRSTVVQMRRCGVCRHQRHDCSTRESVTRNDECSRATKMQKREFSELKSGEGAQRRCAQTDIDSFVAAWRLHTVFNARNAVCCLGCSVLGCHCCWLVAAQSLVRAGRQRRHAHSQRLA